MVMLYFDLSRNRKVDRQYLLQLRDPYTLGTSHAMKTSSIELLLMLIAGIFDLACYVYAFEHLYLDMHCYFAVNNCKRG